MLWTKYWICCTNSKRQLNNKTQTRSFSKLRAFLFIYEVVTVLKKVEKDHIRGKVIELPSISVKEVNPIYTHIVSEIRKKRYIEETAGRERRRSLCQKNN